MASKDTATSLRQLLTQKKPPIHCLSKVGKNSTNSLWPDFREVEIWEDFTLKNLNESYGHVLDEDVSNFELVMPQPQKLEDTVTVQDKDVRNLIGWHDDLMQIAVQVAKRRLGLRIGHSLTYRYWTADASFLAHLPTASCQTLVDHVIGLDDPLDPVLVVGFGRTVQKWNCPRLVAQLRNLPRGKQTGQLVWPLRQLANTCQKAGTRYGYIQTEEALVVCCFSSNGPGLWKAAIMPVPWTGHGVQVLTTELALWWLCMLAMAPDHGHRVVREEHMTRINEWDVVYLDQERGCMRRHRYSHVMMPAEASWLDPESSAMGNTNSLNVAHASSLAFAHNPHDPMTTLGDPNNPHSLDSDFFSDIFAEEFTEGYAG
ncbi:hypothetical protein ED733_001918 [Metarhizium rileyi]|uniref:Uncharacterized protein n=1 Tax=Metarhizium rileyi (strain RCEF 4871) TaxID=1649241 RepID=A0A5C6G7H4_METRR|nr:hypothetical protein ED733_001918 [Metarhizium rileyi]